MYVHGSVIGHVQLFITLTLLRLLPHNIPFQNGVALICVSISGWRTSYLAVNAFQHRHRQCAREC
jgi:hypothetical protein